MKKVKITITGDIIATNYCGLSLIDEDNDFLSQCYLTCGWNKVTGMYIDAPEDTDFDEYEGDNMIKKSGGYSGTNGFFHDLWNSEDSDHILPVECHSRIYNNEYVDYIIRLRDDEEFDIKKVQIQKSKNEIEKLPDYMVADYILYNGLIVMNVSDFEYYPDEKIYDEWTCEGFME